MVGAHIAKHQRIPVKLLQLRFGIGRGRNEVGAAQRKHDSVLVAPGFKIVQPDQQFEDTCVERERLIFHGPIGDMTVIRGIGIIWPGHLLPTLGCLKTNGRVRVFRLLLIKSRVSQIRVISR